MVPSISNLPFLIELFQNNIFLHVDAFISGRAVDTTANPLQIWPRTVSGGDHIFKSD